MNVAVAVSGGPLPRWKAWCIDALRRDGRLGVRVVPAPDAARAPRRVRAPLGCGALAPAPVAHDDGELSGADAIVDLTERGVTAEARFGVWRFRLGDDDDERLPFARETADTRTTFGVMLLRRRHGSDEVLRAGSFAITRWYPTTVRIALAECARWPATLLGAIADGIDVPALSAVRRSAPRRLGPWTRLRFAAALARRLASALVTGFFEIAEWNVGFVEGEPARLLAREPLEVRWLPAPAPHTFIADPFIVERDGVRALFVETYAEDEGRGAIEVLVLDDGDNVVRRVRAIERDTHLSYPYPVEIDGTLYLVPENCAANEVALYRCVSFPDAWERETALFPAFDGVDTTLFAHGGRWWAFCTRYSRGSTLALNVFYAPSPRGPWSPHALNPVVVDVASARPAGQPFVVDGVLYRPAQDCSGSYGGGLVIARVDELSPTAYCQEIVQRHGAAGFGRWSDGIHTVSFARGRFVVDGKRTYRDARKIVSAAMKIRSVALRRLLRRPRASEETEFA